MSDEPSPPIRAWRQKFGHALRGVRRGVAGQNSFAVHFFFAAVVVVAAAVLRMRCVEWCLLLLCIAMVMAAEMFNSAMESMARAVTSESNSSVRTALDISSAAVLVAAGGAVVVGLVLFIHRLGELALWW